MTATLPLHQTNARQVACPQTLIPAPQTAELGRLAARHGRSGLAPFLTNPDLVVVRLRDGAAAYAERGRWAVTAGDVVAPVGRDELALSEYLDVLAQRRRTPAFVAVSDPIPYRRRGLAVSPVADEAVLDLTAFSLAGPARSSLRHSVSSARRLGLRAVPAEPAHDPAIVTLSEAWLRTKRGGEYGFTLSRCGEVAEQVAAGVTESWVCVDERDRVHAWCTWRHYAGGRARVLDVMRRDPQAANPAMDFLLCSALTHYRDHGVRTASLAGVPRDRGTLAEHAYPTRCLRAYKEKFAPTWETRWLVVPASWQTPLALIAIGRAYSSGPFRAALRHNR